MTSPVTSLLTREIAEQPDVLARLLDAQLPRLAAWRRALRADSVDGIVVVARGSSDNAARYAQYLWSLRTGLPVGLATPSLHTVYGGRVDVRGKAVVALSQSGASPDVVAVLAAAREQGAPAVAITNAPGSPLAEVATEVLDLDAGPERSVAATKTYTSSVLAVALLAVALGDPADEAEQVAELHAIPGAVAAAIALTQGLEQAVAVLAEPRRGVVVGRGLNLGTAYEAALKLTELTGSLMAPYSPADLLHGPVAALGPDVPVLAMAPAPLPAGARSPFSGPVLRRKFQTKIRAITGFVNIDPKSYPSQIEETVSSSARFEPPSRRPATKCPVSAFPLSPSRIHARPQESRRRTRPLTRHQRSRRQTEVRSKHRPCYDQRHRRRRVSQSRQRSSLYSRQPPRCQHRDCR